MIVSVMRLTWDIFGGEADPLVVAIVNFNWRWNSSYLLPLFFRFFDFLVLFREVPKCVSPYELETRAWPIDKDKQRMHAGVRRWHL